MIKRWCSVAPLRYSWSWPDIDPPYELSPGVTIGKNPDWYCDDVFKESLSKDQYNDLAFAPHAIMYRFESDSLEQLDNSWKGLGQRNLLDKALEIIQFANMSLWMAKPTTANYERVVTFEISDTPNIKIDGCTTRLFMSTHFICR